MTRRVFFALPLPFLLVIPAAAVEQADATRDMWHTLAQVEFVFDADAGTADYPGGYVTKFGDGVRELSGKTVELQGFMMPLENAEKQSNFLLVRQPVAGCRYCKAGGSSTMIEIRAKEPIKFSYDRVTIQGTLQLLTDDPMGLFYRMTEAQVAD